MKSGFRFPIATIASTIAALLFAFLLGITFQQRVLAKTPQTTLIFVLTLGLATCLTCILYFLLWRAAKNADAQADRPEEPAKAPTPFIRLLARDLVVFSELSRPHFLLLSLVATSAAGWLLWRHWTLLNHFGIAGIRLAFDSYDIFTSYFPATHWVAMHGLPFVDSRSEYPLLANLLFGYCRWLSEILPVLADPQSSMAWWWIVHAFFALLWLVRWTTSEVSFKAAFLWLTPAVVYFTLYRFDFYPAALSFAGIIFCQKERWTAAALAFGLSIALKGYFLFALPTVAVFWALRIPGLGWMKYVLLAMIPMIFQNVIVWAVGGWDAMMQPYLFHQNRGFNGESTFDAIAILLHATLGGSAVQEILKAVFENQRIPHLLQLGAALLAAGMKPRTIEQLALAILFSILAFWNFQVFSSPQYVLWLLPFFCYLRPGFTFQLGFGLLIVSYLYFPVMYDLRPHFRSETAFDLSVFFFTIGRMTLMVSAFFALIELRKQTRKTLCTNPNTT